MKEIRFTSQNQMRRLLFVAFVTIALLLPYSVCGKGSVTISSAKELRQLPADIAGTEIVWRDGSYHNQVVTITASGTEREPIIIRAETLGGVRFTGASSLRIKGSHIIVRGFCWDNPLPEKGVVISFDKVSSHSVMEQCVITGENSPMRPQNNIKWVSLWGYKNRVEHCSFLDKRDLGQILIVRIAEGEQPPQHVVRNCYFTRPNFLRNEKGGRINGQCCIRFGTSDVTHLRAECVVEHCHFDRCNGEGEIVSNKCGGNIFRNNLFYACRGSLSLRHGNEARVIGNYFLGNDEPLTGGIRAVGENHIISGNYLSNLRIGSATRRHGAIHLMQGQKDATAGGYPQVKGAVVRQNIIVNCRYGISANAQRDDCVLPVIGSVVEQNIVVASGDCCTVACEDAQHDIVWRGNKLYGGYQRGISLEQTKKAPKLPKIDSAVESIRSNAGALFVK